MRRTTFGLAGLAVVFVAGTAFMAQALAPAHSHAARPAPAVHAAPAGAAPASFPPAQLATVVDTVMAAVPLTTQIASPKSPVGVVYWPTPGQNITGQVGATTWGGPTALPVVRILGEWAQVRLGSRPNGSTGWVRLDEVNLITTSYRIAISVGQRNLTLYQSGQVIYTAPVGVGKAQWPTPLGPSYIAALVPVPPSQQRVYGPVVAITGSHSNVFQTFEGGDGTVAIHGYPSDPRSTAGVASSHGCIRVSPQTMTALGQVPPGTPIDIIP